LEDKIKTSEPKDLPQLPELTNLDLLEWREEGIVNIAD
jgi:hypothetical protein